MSIKNFPEFVYQKLHQFPNNPYLRKVTLANFYPDDLGIYLNGKEINPASYDLIAAANDEVLMHFYKFDASSDAGQDIIKGILELNKKGVSGKKIKVQIIIDRLLGPANWFTGRLGDPLAWLKHDGDMAYVEMAGKRIDLNNLDIQTKCHGHYLFNSYHLKEIIVDKKQLMVRSGDVWRDTDYRANQEGRTEIATLLRNPDLAAEAAKSFHARWDRQPFTSSPFHQAANYDTKQTSILFLEKNASTNPIKRYFFQSGLKIALLTAIQNSTTSIKILTPNLNDQAILDALIMAVKRGVKVSIVTGKYHNQWLENMPTMGGANQKSIIRIFNKTPFQYWDNIDVRWARDKHLKVIPDQDPKAMHAKLVIIDDMITFTGSSPIDYQGMYNSAESDCVMSSAEIAENYTTKIFNPISQLAQPYVSPRLDLVKQSIIMDIKQIHLKEITIGRKENTATLTDQKKQALDNLATSINLAGSFNEIEKILKSAAVIDAKNPFAQNRRRHLFSFFNKPFGKTATIAKLESIYHFYIHDHLLRKTVVNHPDPDIIAPGRVNL